MTLLITVFAACITTILWYKKAPDDSMKLGFLALMYWGASLMWMCDAIFEYKELGAEFFAPEAVDMINDGYVNVVKMETAENEEGSDDFHLREEDLPEVYLR